MAPVEQGGDGNGGDVDVDGDGDGDIDGDDDGGAPVTILPNVASLIVKTQDCAEAFLVASES